MLTPTMPPPPRPPLPRAAEHGVCPFAVEAQAIDQALVGHQPKQARARIAGLRQRGNGADFDKAEAQAQQRIGDLAVLVKACRHAERVGKVETEGPYRKRAVIGGRLSQRREPQRRNRKPVRVLGLHEAQERQPQAIEQADHETGSGNTWRPSRSSGSGLVHTTACRLSGP
jgi:hypothetical protein